MRQSESVRAALTILLCISTLVLWYCIYLLSLDLIFNRFAGLFLVFGFFLCSIPFTFHGLLLHMYQGKSSSDFFKPWIISILFPKKELRPSLELTKKEYAFLCLIRIPFYAFIMIYAIIIGVALIFTR